MEFLKHVVLTTESKNEEDEEKDEEKKSIAFDEFFPFDPYLLPKSGEMYVTQGIYNKWDESTIKVDDDEEEEDEDEEGTPKRELWIRRNRTRARTISTASSSCGFGHRQHNQKFTRQ